MTNDITKLIPITNPPKGIYIQNESSQIGSDMLYRSSPVIMYNESANPTFCSLKGYHKEVQVASQLVPVKAHCYELGYKGKLHLNKVASAIMKELAEFISREKPDLTVLFEEQPTYGIRIYSSKDRKPLEVTISLSITPNKMLKGKVGAKNNFIFELRGLGGNEQEHHIFELLSSTVRPIVKMDDEIFTRVFITEPIWKLLRERKEQPNGIAEHHNAEPDGLLAHGK